MLNPYSRICIIIKVKWYQQVGFARVITDCANSTLLKDLFIVEPYRGQRLRKWFVQYILEAAELQDVQRWLLGTKDANGLYRRYGLKNLTESEKMMMRIHLNGYEN
ncbi:hypothetical protein BV372_12165 [Nostoc sp. T09]|uniref:GNAT family N-acetyltransferase n=1 Tax=Nostoc sp. T09 TaxID=1932621 RepID=UPI000B63592E|nr:GNAT family N-acetyltransferase [Nostoc sp. T09]OUL35104.1 hypothetical protein BV372_12165 [Nostoc sp. T09]